MKILFIDPPGDKGARSLNTSIAYCAGNLRKHNHTVSVLDLNNIRTGDPFDRLKKAVDTFKPDMVGFSVMNLSYYFSINLAEKIRPYYQGLIIFGGAEASAQGEGVFNYTNSVDIVVVGEAEHTIVELCNGDKLKKINGLIWKKGKTVIKNPLRKPEKNLDDLPYPDFEVFGIKEMAHHNLLTSRGCPFNCSFCFKLEQGWRGRNIKECIKELEFIIEKYKISDYLITDPCFNATAKRVEDFCDEIMSKKITLPWQILGMRADRITNSTAEKLKKANCQKVWIGIESMHEEVFKKIGKGESIEDIKNGIRIFQKHKIQVYGYLIIGLPGDTLERTCYSFKEARKLHLNALNLSSAVPFTGTKLDKWVKDNAKLLVDPLTISSLGTRYDEIAYETKDFSFEERKKARLILNIKAQSHTDLTIPKWLYCIQKIYFTFKYDWKSLFQRIYNSIRFRWNKRYLDKFTQIMMVSFARIPDGTWGLSKDERLPSRVKLKINLREERD